MKKLPFFFLVTWSAMSSAASDPLNAAVNALSLPSDATHSANSWHELDAIPDIAWDRDGIDTAPNGGFFRRGSLGTSEFGSVDVSFHGVRTMVLELRLAVGEENGVIFEKEEFEEALRKVVGSDAAIKPIRGGCHDEGFVSGSAVFSVTLTGRKPLFVMTSTDAGGSSPESRSSTMAFSVDLPERWSCR